MKYKILKNTHFSLPPVFRTGKNFTWSYEISIEDIYNLGTIDQYDWNKLIGIKQEYFKPKENSVMVGWRYNVETNKNEVCFYSHTNGNREFTEPVFSIDLKDKFIVTFVVEGNYVGCYITYGNLTASKVFKYEANKRWYLISSWFGGNCKAPNTIYINKTKLQ